MANGVYCEHFGGARAFAIFESVSSGGVVRTNLLAAPEHKPGALPKWLEAHDVNAVVASAIGKPALTLLAKAGINVFLAGFDTDPTALAGECAAGRLTIADATNTSCSQDHDHDGHTCRH